MKQYFEQGLFGPIFQVRRDLNVFKKIADNKDIIKKQERELVLLFVYLQRSAQDNFVLGTCRIFDKSSSRFNTLCIEDFLKKVLKEKSKIKLRKTWNIQHKIGRFQYNEELYNKIESNNSNAVDQFLDYYKIKYKSPALQEKLDCIKYVRDKFIAHNELMPDDFDFDPIIIQELMDFAEELIDVYNELFLGKMYVKRSGDENAYFINHAFKRLGIE